MQISLQIVTNMDAKEFETRNFLLCCRQYPNLEHWAL